MSLFSKPHRVESVETPTHRVLPSETVFATLKGDVRGLSEGCPGDVRGCPRDVRDVLRMSTAPQKKRFHVRRKVLPLREVYVLQLNVDDTC